MNDSDVDIRDDVSYDSANNDYEIRAIRKISPANSPRMKKDSRKNSQFSELPLAWWERSEECKHAKMLHTERIDSMIGSREDVVHLTTLSEADIVLEPNMFPYDTPAGVAHYTLWARYDLSHEEIIDFVDNWLLSNFPQVRRWQYDDNCGVRSILLFHVHVFIELIPFSFNVEASEEYFPPHMRASLGFD